MKTLLYLFICFWVLSLSSCGVGEGRGDGVLQERALHLVQTGKRYEAKADVRQALICYWDVLDLLSTSPDTVLKATTYNRVGDLLFRYGLYEKAVVNHRESYDLAQRLGDAHLLAETTRRLSLDYTLLNQSDTAAYFAEW